MTDLFIRISGPRFAADIVIRDDQVTEAAPPLTYMVGWRGGEVQALCPKKGWRVSRVKPAMPPSGDR